MTLTSEKRQSLMETIEVQRLGCELNGSALYSRILTVVANDVRDGGLFAELLEPVADAPFGDAVLLRLLGALHRVVLAGQASELSDYYPSVGGDVPADHAGLPAIVLATAEAHRSELAEGLTQGVQTNEVGRSAALVGGFLALGEWGMPLRVLEVGASAGLNLLFDRFRYQQGADGFGPARSPLVFEDPWVGRAPDLSGHLEVAERRGSDVDPVDVSTPEGRRRLRSFVWPDQAHRLARLDGALAVAQAGPPRVERDDAVTWLRAQLQEPAVGMVTVVAHSIMFQYLSPAQQTEMVDVIAQAGLRASSGAPLAWLRLEPGGDHAELRLRVWPGEVTHLLATSGFHGPPVHWLSPRLGGPGTGSKPRR